MFKLGQLLQVLELLAVRFDRFSKRARTALRISAGVRAVESTSEGWGSFPMRPSRVLTVWRSRCELCRYFSRMLVILSGRFQTSPQGCSRVGSQRPNLWIVAGILGKFFKCGISFWACACVNVSSRTFSSSSCTSLTICPGSRRATETGRVIQISLIKSLGPLRSDSAKADRLETRPWMFTCRS